MNYLKVLGYDKGKNSFGHGLFGLLLTKTIFTLIISNNPRPNSINPHQFNKTQIIRAHIQFILINTNYICLNIYNYYLSVLRHHKHKRRCQNSNRHQSTSIIGRKSSLMFSHVRFFALINRVQSFRCLFNFNTCVQWNPVELG